MAQSEAKVVTRVVSAWMVHDNGNSMKSPE
jgi:hypothetical protein